MKTTRFLSPDCDLQILLFLWQWKLATSATLGFRFFKDRPRKQIYRKLNSLENFGYIETRLNEHINGSVWVLSQKGYVAIEPYLPELKEKGFKSEYLYHDFLVNALHLGDWLSDRPKNVEIFTEQQLRRFDFEFYPPWVPKTLVHRPDGYFHFKTPQARLTVALEVELNTKCRASYSGLEGFYSTASGIDRVIWIVPTIKSLNSLQSLAAETNSSEQRIHNFVLLDHFKETGWASEIESGPEHGETLHHLFGKMAGTTLGKPRGIWPERVPHKFLSDGKKSRFLTAV